MEILCSQMLGGEKAPLKLKQGQAIFFASFLRHKVAPVKKGVRKSLVMWFGGPPFNENKINYKEKYFFPTAVYFKDVANAKELNKYLFKEIKKWRKADPEGEKKTDFWFGWHSKTDMDKRKEYKPLIDELFQMAYECNKDYGITGKLGLGNMWANINPYLQL